jgi:hypothetical protein
MKCGLKKSAGALSMTVAVMLFVAMVLPDPAARLCIAPGNHIAIEGMSSDCCGSHEISVTAESHGRDGFESAGDCGHCTDLPILSFGPETIRTSPGATGIPAFENPAVIAAAEFSTLLSAPDRIAHITRGRLSSSLPLLC